MKWSKTLIQTLREDPQEAEIASHKLMLRAGLIRRLAGGLYTFLPLGLRALRKVEKIIREEMDKAGAIELLMPALQPRELWDKSERYTLMGDVMFKITDRQNKEFLLGPTHEEVITDLVAHEVKSYRQLPKTFYQIQTKFRDEIRPRFGLMRAKEFIMKDAYSFDLGWDEADISYQAMYNAYIQIFKRCGLKTKVVEADTGAMGGKWSHEFMVLADSGEDSLVECSSCSYAANIERAERALKNTTPSTNSKIPEEVNTPNMKTIKDVSSFLKCKPEEMIKTLIYTADKKPIAILIPGDRDVNENKLLRFMKTSNLSLAENDDVVNITGAPVGFAGPVGLNIDIYADISLKNNGAFITGANKKDTHLKDVSLERDTSIKEFHDLCLVRDGDVCPHCNGILKEKRGIEVGHVFKLGTKYSKAFDASYLDVNGKKETIVMGCYGIGVTRTLQSAVEQNHDKNGIIWPISVAPYSVVILVMNINHQESMDTAKLLKNNLIKENIDVLLDDRDERPGVKFKDADLIGFPIRVVIGERSLSERNVEIKLRTWEKPKMVNIDTAVKKIINLFHTEQ